MMGWWVKNTYTHEKQSYSINYDMVWKDIRRINVDIDDEEDYLSEIIILFYGIYKIVQIDNEHVVDIYDVIPNNIYNNV